MLNNKNIFFDKNKMSEMMMNVANKITQLFVIWKRKIDALIAINYKLYNI